MKIFALAITVVTALSCGAAEAEPMKLRIQWATTPGALTPLMPEAPRTIYRHWGQSYVVEPVFMAGSTPALTALAAGELEIVGLTPQSLVIGVVEAKQDLRAILQQVTTDLPGWAANEYWVRDDIQKISDLRGKVVGVNARGSAVDAAAQLMLRKNGMEAGRDYQIAEIRFPAMLPSLEAKNIDLAYLVKPFDLMAAKKPGYHALFTMGDAVGPAETSFLAAKADWIAKNRAALVDFMEDELRLRRWAHDPATRPEAIKLLARVTKQPEDAFADWVFTNKENYRAPDGRFDVARMQKNVDDLKAGGALPTTIDVKGYIDLTPVADAQARLGK